MLVIPPGLVGPFLEAEAEVLPAGHLADLGERHPESLRFNAADETLGEDCVVALQGAAKTPLRVECELAEAQMGGRLLRRQSDVVGQEQLFGARVVAGAEKGRARHVDS